MEQHVEKRSLGQRYEVALIIVSVAITLAVVAGLTLFPEQGTALADDLLYLLTRTFGSFMQVFTVIVLVFLVALGVSKYGEIRLGTAKPKYRTTTWVAMMFFSGLGAGTVYWAFLEWGYHFNAAPKLAGAEISEAYAYELSLAYTLFDWGPSAWALLCVFALPFGYHYYIKKDQELRLSALCKYTLGEKRTRGF